MLFIFEAWVLKKGDILSQAVTSETNPRLGYIMKMTLKWIWELEIWFRSKKLKKQKHKAGLSKGSTEIGKKAIGISSWHLLPMDWLLFFFSWTDFCLAPLYQTQMPRAFTVGSPQIPFSFSASHVLFCLCQLSSFPNHYFISSVAKLPLLAENRII